MPRQSTITPDEAMEKIDRLKDERASLSRRTAGLTWIVWGLVLAGMAMYTNLWEVFGLDEGPNGALIEQFQPLVVLAWPLVGYLITRVIWRSSGLTVPGIGDVSRGKRALRYAGLVLAAVGTPLVAGYLRGLVNLPAIPDLVFLSVLGGVTVAAGLLGVVCHDRLERGVAVGMGVTVLVAAFATAATLNDPSNQDRHRAVATPGDLVSDLVTIENPEPGEWRWGLATTGNQGCGDLPEGAGCDGVFLRTVGLTLKDAGT